MSNFRFTALEKTLNRPIGIVVPPSLKVSDYYGSMTFNSQTMKEYLTDEA